MKNFLTATSVLLFFTSAYLGFRVYQLTHPVPRAPVSCPSLPYDYSKGDFAGVIGYETAKALYANYINDAAKNKIWPKEINNVSAFLEKEEDTKSVWFSLERLKNFIWHIEEQNCVNSCNDSLGLRIYFAKYPDLNSTLTGYGPDLIGIPKNYSNHHTLFMVPTYKNEHSENVDFYPGTKTCRAPFSESPLKPHLPGDDLNLKVYAPTPFIFLMGTLEDAQNHGGLIPPGDPAGTSFQ